MDVCCLSNPLTRDDLIYGDKVNRKLLAELKKKSTVNKKVTKKPVKKKDVSKKNVLILIL